MKKIWFRRKLYGWGWYPCSWQGWVVILVYVIILSLLISIFETNIEKYLIFYLVSVFTLTGLLIYICYKKGEKPKWQWGKRKDDMIE